MAALNPRTGNTPEETHFCEWAEKQPCVHIHLLPSRRSSALCRPTEKSASVRGGMCVLFRVCFSSLGDPGETPALQPTLTFADRVYEWLKIGGVVSTTPVLGVSLGHTEVRCAKCFGFIQCHLCYYITTMASGESHWKVGWLSLYQKSSRIIEKKDLIRFLQVKERYNENRGVKICAHTHL